MFPANRDQQPIHQKSENQIHQQAQYGEASDFLLLDRDELMVDLPGLLAHVVNDSRWAAGDQIQVQSDHRKGDDQDRLTDLQGLVNVFIGCGFIKEHKDRRSDAKAVHGTTNTGLVRNERKSKLMFFPFPRERIFSRL